MIPLPQSGVFFFISFAKRGQQKKFASLFRHSWLLSLALYCFYEVFGEMAFMTKAERKGRKECFHEQFRCRWAWNWRGMDGKVREAKRCFCNSVRNGMIKSGPDPIQNCVVNISFFPVERGWIFHAIHKHASRQLKLLCSFSPKIHSTFSDIMSQASPRKNPHCESRSLFRPPLRNSLRFWFIREILFFCVLLLFMYQTAFFSPCDAVQWGLANY